MAAPINGPILVRRAGRSDIGEGINESPTGPVYLDIGWCDIEEIDFESVTLAFGRWRADPEDPDHGSYYEFNVTPADARRLADLLLAAAANCEDDAADDGIDAGQHAAEASSATPAA
jgi:hypothetical protein